MKVPSLVNQPNALPFSSLYQNGLACSLGSITTSSVIDQLPSFLVSSSAGLIGFLSLKLHNSYSAEIYVMGILPGMHRLGIGKALVNAAQTWLKLQATEFLQVKTLGPSDPDPNYARTRAFYLAMGFRPLEEFHQIWDANNPCLILVKRL